MRLLADQIEVWPKRVYYVSAANAPKLRNAITTTFEHARAKLPALRERKKQQQQQMQQMQQLQQAQQAQQARESQMFAEGLKQAPLIDLKLPTARKGKAAQQQQQQQGQISAGAQTEAQVTASVAQSVQQQFPSWNVPTTVAGGHPQSQPPAALAHIARTETAKAQSPVPSTKKAGKKSAPKKPRAPKGKKAAAAAAKAPPVPTVASKAQPGQPVGLSASVEQSAPAQTSASAPVVVSTAGDAVRVVQAPAPTLGDVETTAARTSQSADVSRVPTPKEDDKSVQKENDAKRLAKINRLLFPYAKTPSRKRPIDSADGPGAGANDRGPLQKRKLFVEEPYVRRPRAPPRPPGRDHLPHKFCASLLRKLLGEPELEQAPTPPPDPVAGYKHAYREVPRNRALARLRKILGSREVGDKAAAPAKQTEVVSKCAPSIRRSAEAGAALARALQPLSDWGTPRVIRRLSGKARVENSPGGGRAHQTDETFEQRFVRTEAQTRQLTLPEPVVRGSSSPVTLLIWQPRWNAPNTTVLRQPRSVPEAHRDDPPPSPHTSSYPSPARASGSKRQRKTRRLCTTSVGGTPLGCSLIEVTQQHTRPSRLSIRALRP
ncbi:MAG: hypothetical protein BJ554DRAFT_3568 [Olpidium bornovanus]|uniref:Uncharacterized protein n=1 Tax=Olpidium bornovanus TaxID=278681 RepID=A0A8H8A0N1_9FUNG|nr:MAG: hypothetical protein BJ554DRAFT_3568 [Olpidium bornovanus]